MSQRRVPLPWESYCRRGLISRRRLITLTALLGGAVTVGADPASVVRPAAEAAAVAAPTNQVLRFPNQEPLHFDPGMIEALPEILVAMSLFDPLIAFDNDTGRMIPLTARSFDVSRDGLTYTFHLRSGMQWSDGHSLTAADYEYSWKRVLDPALGSGYASAMYPIKGAVDYNKGQTKTPDNVGVKAVDAVTLQVVLAAPAAYFPRLASTWTYMPVPQWQVEKYGPKWVEPGNHVGNGPFMLQSWEHDKEMVIVANPRYWGPKPTLQKVVFTISDNPGTTSVPAYENNELDATWQIQPADIRRFRSDPTRRAEVHKFRMSGTTMISCDTVNTGSPLNNLKVRQAFYLATDRSQLANDVLQGLYDPAPTITPQGTIGNLATPPLTGNVIQARQLLAEAGYPDGKGFPGFKLVYRKLGEIPLVAEALQQMWRDRLNVTVNLEQMEVKEFAAAVSSFGQQPFDAFLSRWGADYADPANWANILYDSQSDLYHTRWHNTQFDSLVRAGAAEQNPTKRRQLYESAEKLLDTDVPSIPLYHLAWTMAIRPYVQGFEWPAAASSFSGVFARVQISNH